MTEPPAQFKSGFLAIVGRPNVGKSTLLNALLGVKLAIATDKPQTTRNRILGVQTYPERGQLVFVDTPGIHAARDRLNKRMVDAAWDAAQQTDAIVFVVDARSLVHEREEVLWGGDKHIADRLRTDAEGLPVVLVINKVDTLPNKNALLPTLARLAAEHSFAAMVPVSARRKDNLDGLVDALLENLPEGPALYPDDMLTNRAERFLAAEYVREQILRLTEREVPYSVAVEIEQFAENADDGRLYIRAVIHVERNSQKAILIGKGGQRIREIGTAARHQLRQFFGRSVHLETLVRVEGDWTASEKTMDRFGYGADEI